MKRKQFERKVDALGLGIAIVIDRPRKGEIQIYLDSPPDQHFSGTGTHALSTHYYTDPDVGLDDAWADLVQCLPLEPCSEECEQ
jgi:hypothetical protein